MSVNDKSELNLKDLISLSNSLNKSIRQLENSRQQLIFDHHYELIHSSDNMTVMKTSLEELSPITSSLRDRLALIGNAEDTTKLKQSVLLEQIIKLPQLLQYLVDNDKLDIAHSIYTTQSYNINRLIAADVRGISRINSKCISIIGL